jgi:pyruvate dehydrogenase (quinone)
MAQTVADTLVESLAALGVRQVFGVVGDALNPFTEALRRDGRIEWIGVRHEEGAALAAAGQAKLTGRLGVCAGTTGPGGNHLVAGLYEARKDHAPVLAITGDVKGADAGVDFLQANDHLLLFRDVAAYACHLASPAAAARVIHEAAAQAYAAPGVAHLNIPQDVIGAKAHGGSAATGGVRPTPDFAPDPADVQAAARLIDAAGRVTMLVGAGARRAEAEVLALSDRLQAPLVHTFRGKDLVAYDDPRWIGGVGLIGGKPGLRAVNEADLLLMLGSDYPYREFLPSKGAVVQIDRRPGVLGRRTPVALGVVGCVKPTLASLLGAVAAKSDGGFRAGIGAERTDWERMLTEKADPSRSADRIHPQAAARMLSDLADPDAVFVIDTGAVTLWCGNWIRQSGRQRILASFNNAAVGTALGQANGVQALDRSRQVIAACGDGGFTMLMGEFMTAVQHRLPVKVVVFNNGSWGMVRLEMEAAGLLPAEGADFPNCDFAAFARACGAAGFAAGAPDELEPALSGALACVGPAIVDVRVDRDELPTMPHVALDEVWKFGVAKLKEAWAG